MCGSAASTTATGSPTWRTFPMRENRLIVKRRTVVRIRHQRQRPRRSVMTACTPSSASAALDIDPHDAAVRDGAAVDLAVEHPGQTQVDGCTRRCRRPWRALEARHRSTDFATLRAVPIQFRRLECCGIGSLASRCRPVPARALERPAHVHPHHLALVGGAAADVGQRLDLPGRGVGRRRKGLRRRRRRRSSAASAPATRTGRSVAALTATRASAIGPPSVRYQTATPTDGQSSADSAENFAYT